MNDPTQFVCSQAVGIATGIISYSGLASIVPLHTAVSGGLLVWIAFAQLAFIEDVLRGINND